MPIQGTLPEALGALGALQQFVMADNMLSGSIPAYVGSYPGVGEAWLEYNMFSGGLSQHLCDSPAGHDNLHLQVPSHCHGTLR